MKVQFLLVDTRKMWDQIASVIAASLGTVIDGAVASSREADQVRGSPSRQLPRTTVLILLFRRIRTAR